MPAIMHDFQIAVVPELVYRAFTEPSQLECWWPLRCSGKAALGEVYNFYFGDEYNWFANVCELSPGRAVYFKMTVCDEDWLPTTFGIEVTNAPQGGASVAFIHKDWVEANNHFRIASFCWAMLLKGLKDYLERGEVVPFAQRS